MSAQLRLEQHSENDLCSIRATVRSSASVRRVLNQADPNDPNKTHLTIIKEVDLKGYVPNWVLKQAFKDQGYIVDRLRKCMPKWKAKFPGDRP